MLNLPLPPQFYIKRGFLLPKYHGNYWLGLNTTSTNGNWTQMDRTFNSKYRLWGTFISELLPARGGQKPLHARSALCNEHLRRAFMRRDNAGPDYSSVLELLAV